MAWRARREYDAVWAGFTAEREEAAARREAARRAWEEREATEAMARVRERSEGKE